MSLVAASASIHEPRFCSLRACQKLLVRHVQDLLDHGPTQEITTSFARFAVTSLTCKPAIRWTGHLILETDPPFTFAVNFDSRSASLCQDRQCFASFRSRRSASSCRCFWLFSTELLARRDRVYPSFSLWRRRTYAPWGHTRPSIIYHGQDFAVRTKAARLFFQTLRVLGFRLQPINAEPDSAPRYSPVGKSSKNANRRPRSA